MPRQCEVPRVEGSNVLSALGEVEPPHVGRDLSDISLYQDSLRGRLPSPARDVRRSLRLPHPGLGFLRSVTHAVCPALWARARRLTVGKTVPACIPCAQPAHLRRPTPHLGRVRRPDPQRVCSRVHRPTCRNPVRDVYHPRYLYSTTLFHLLARPNGLTAASPPRPHAPSRGAGS